MVAEIAATTKNARHGINIIYNAGKLAEQKNEPILTAELIRHAKNNIYPEIQPELLESFSNNKLYIIQALARTLKLDINKTATRFSELYDFYLVICEEYSLLIDDHIIPKSKDKIMQEIFQITQTKIIDIIPKPKKIEDVIDNNLDIILTLNDIPAEILDSRIEKLLHKRLEINQGG
jgi:hypothetical protein